MYKGNRVFPLVEENPSISSNKKEKKDKENKIIILNNSGMNDKIIDINFKKKKSEEDDKSTNSANNSEKELKSKDNNIENNENKKKSFLISKKGYEKYTERLKERTMRIEVERIYKETERLKKMFEEKNSYLHSFDNNPQFQKMLKVVEKQLKYFFIVGLFINIFSATLYFYVTHKKGGLALSSFCISTPEIAISIILFASLKLGLLNDPDLSKTFRLFVIIGFILFLSAFFINFIAGLLSINYLKKIDQLIIRVLIYFLFLLMVFLFISSLKCCLNLFIESALILFKRKTEYSILMINEMTNKSELNFNTNLSLSNNLTTEVLTNASIGLFNVDNNKNEEEKKEEEKYRAYNYFNKFHYSITSARNKEYGNFKN